MNNAIPFALFALAFVASMVATFMWAVSTVTP